MRELRVTVAARFPHDPEAFTQGLLAEPGGFVESTGLHGESTIRRVRFDGGAPDIHPLAPTHFGEGIAAWNDTIWQLTWQEGVAIRRDRRTLDVVDEVAYDAEGWGACADDTEVWTSDGSPLLTRRRPQDLHATAELPVTAAGDPLWLLNDLTISRTGHWAGLIWANVLAHDVLAAIDPATGAVVAAVDARPLRPAWLDAEEAVLNGIAWLPGTDRFLVTGKWWPHLYEVSFAPAPESTSATTTLRNA